MFYPLIWVFIFFLCQSVFVLAFLPKISGPFYTKIESMRDYDDIDTSAIEWKTSLKKVGRYEEAIYGYMRIKKKVGPMSVRMTAEVWGDGGYKKILLDSMQSDNICTDKNYSNFFDKYNGTFYDKECIFQPCTTYMRPLVVDKVIHEHTKTALYGKYRIGLRYFGAGVEVMGHEMVIIIDDLSKTKGHKGQ